MATNTYLKRISQDEKSVAKEGLGIRAQEALLEVSKAGMRVKADIATLNRALTKANRQIPYNVKEVFNISQQIEKAEALQAFIKSTKETDFSDVTV